MKVFNIILSIFVLLLAIALAVSSFFLYEKRELMLEGWGTFSETAQKTAETMDKQSGTKLAETVNTENLHHTKYSEYENLESMKGILKELTEGADNLMRQRDQYVKVFRQIALDVDMKGIPANDKMTGIESSDTEIAKVEQAVANFKGRRDKLVNAVSGSSRIVGVNLNVNEMKNGDPGKALAVLNTKLKSMNDQLNRYKSMANELARLSGNSANVGDSLTAAIQTTDAIKRSFNELQRKLTDTQNKLQSANRQIAQLQNTVSNRDSNISRLNQNLNTQKQENTVLKSIIGMDAENVEKPWKAGGEEARKAVAAKVIEINERFGFIVVDLGTLSRVSQWLGNKNNQVDPKIEKGMKLNIVRDFDTPDVKLIVKGAEVTNVSDRCSIVEVPADSIAEVKVGDTVIVDFAQ
ncbi:MAG: hypothetical protein IKD09_06795 [Lentisphaeria bacterium]|nr:hypothetical protein [Lentisphaeria bacterium]